MRSRKDEQRGFPCKPFLLRLLLVIILVFLIVGILPQTVKPSVIINIKSKNEYFSPLTSKKYSADLVGMKEIALAYYTEEKLPDNVGDSSTLTLNDMQKQNLTTTFIGENNNTYDSEHSYVRLTNIGQDYLLKVNLKDGKRECYLLVHLGTYAYCDKDICEKRINKIS